MAAVDGGQQSLIGESKGGKAVGSRWSWRGENLGERPGVKTGHPYISSKGEIRRGHPWGELVARKEPEVGVLPSQGEVPVTS